MLMGIGSSFWLHLPCKQLTRGPVALPGTRGSEPCWCQLWAVLQCSALSPGTGEGGGGPAGIWLLASTRVVHNGARAWHGSETTTSSRRAEGHTWDAVQDGAVLQGSVGSTL